MNKKIQDKSIALWDEMLTLSLKIYGTKIDRQEWLVRRLRPFVDFSAIERLYQETPSEIVSEKLVDYLAKEEIRRHTRMATTTSATAGLLGGITLWVGVPSDVIQYYAHLVALVQKMAYLYGWQDMMPHGEVTSETRAKITLMIGGAMEIPNANRALHQIASTSRPHTARELLCTQDPEAPTSKVLKEIATMLSIQISKSIASGVIAKSIPILGAITSGAVSFYTFKPLGTRLRQTLRDIERDKRK